MRHKTTRAIPECQITDGQDTGTLRTPCPPSPHARRIQSINITHRWMQTAIQAPHAGTHRVHGINTNTSIGSQSCPPYPVMPYVFEKTETKKKTFEVNFTHMTPPHTFFFFLQFYTRIQKLVIVYGHPPPWKTCFFVFLSFVPPPPWSLGGCDGCLQGPAGPTLQFPFKL